MQFQLTFASILAANLSQEMVLILRIEKTLHQSLLVVSTVLCPDMVVMYFLIVYLIKHLDNDQ